MKKIFTKLTVALAAITSVSFAQQDPQFTQFMHNKLMYNPGYAGTSQAICTNVMYRQQWVNFPGAPKTAALSFDMPVGNLPLGIGLNVMNDQIGYAKTLFARLALAWNKQGLGPGILGVGIDGGILQQQFNGKWITPDVGPDQSIPGTYAGGNNPQLNKLTYDLGFGAFYTIPNKMYVGISTTHLGAQDLSAGSNVKYSLARHYYIMGGYTFNLTPEHSLQPNVKIKTDAASTQLDLNLTYSYKQNVWFGVSYRMQDAIAPMIGARFLPSPGSTVGNLKVGYSYDLTLSKIKGYSAGTHEIMLGYCFTVKKPKKFTNYQNTRQLD
ncbi:MAG: type IX secretion system membrane protein PorP/SprF [Bacteroidota bacterium]